MTSGLDGSLRGRALLLFAALAGPRPAPAVAVLARAGPGRPAALTGPCWRSQTRFRVRPASRGQPGYPSDAPTGLAGARRRGSGFARPQPGRDDPRAAGMQSQHFTEGTVPPRLPSLRRRSKTAPNRRMFKRPPGIVTRARPSCMIGAVYNRRREPAFLPRTKIDDINGHHIQR